MSRESEIVLAEPRPFPPARSSWVAATPGLLRPDARVRLFCLPYAGGGAAVFRSWPASLPRSIEVCPVRLPGREMRLREPAITSFPVMMHALTAALRPYLAEPYAFFGHSMGAILAYEAMAHLADLGHRLPVGLFVAGRHAPHLTRDVLPLPVQELSDAELMQNIVRLNEGARAVVTDTDLAALVLPILRADFTLCQSYRPRRRPPFPVPLTVLGGLSDPTVGRAELLPWAEHTTSSFSLHMLPGDHLFLSGAAAGEVQRMVGATLGVLAGHGRAEGT